MSLEKAISYARKNPIQSRGRSSISRFSAILRLGSLEVVGFNRYVSHPLMYRFGSNSNCIFLHAELDAIRKAIQILAKKNGSSYRDITDLSDWRMYVARVLKDGTPAMAMPCAGCQRALVAFGITEVEWTE